MKKFYLMVGIICATLALMVASNAQAEAPPGLDLGNAVVTNANTMTGVNIERVNSNVIQPGGETANLKDMTVANFVFTDARGCNVEAMANNAMATEARSFIIATADATTVYLTANALATAKETEVSGATGAEIVATFVVNPAANTAYCDDATINALQPDQATEVKTALAVTRPTSDATLAGNNIHGTNVVHAIMPLNPAEPQRPQTVIVA